jgi:hypothetical protein
VRLLVNPERRIRDIVGFIVFCECLSRPVLGVVFGYWIVFVFFVICSRTLEIIH